MKKNLLFALALLAATTTEAQQRHELQLTPFAWFDVPTDHFLQVGYFYNRNQRSAVGARVSYHARDESELYTNKSQLRFFEISHRWRFQKPEKKLFWTLSTGPWGAYFTGQYENVLGPYENWSAALGIATTGGLHVQVLPRWSVGIVGLTTLEVLQMDFVEKERSFYPVVTPGVGLQVTYAW
jgi:hypothetical protein